MLDFFTIFSKGGIVLWCFQGTSQLFTPAINSLIKSVILQVRKISYKTKLLVTHVMWRGMKIEKYDVNIWKFYIIKSSYILKITQFINTIIMNTVTWNPGEKMKMKKRQTISNNLNNDKTKREVVQFILDTPPPLKMEAGQIGPKQNRPQIKSFNDCIIMVCFI